MPKGEEAVLQINEGDWMWGAVSSRGNLKMHAHIDGDSHILVGGFSYVSMDQC